MRPAGRWTVIAVSGQIKDLPPAAERARLKWEYQGFRGANRALDYFRRTQHDDAVKPANYVLLKAQEAQGGLGSYLVALRRYGFVHPERFELTPLGQELAARFLRGTRRPAQLGAGDRVRRGMLASLGERLSLARNPTGEAELIRAAVFTGDHESAVVLRRIPRMLRRPDRSHAAMTAIARRDGDALERAAQYGLDFDPLRRSALLLFSQLGRSLIGKAGPVTLRDLVDAWIEETCGELRAHAAVLANNAAPRGLEPVTVLAERLTTGPSEVDTIQAVVAFHRQEGRRWIEAVGSRRIAVAIPGRFDPPREGFHGYTLPSALRIYRDLEEST